MAEARREPATAPIPPGAQEAIDRLSALFRAAAPSVEFSGTANAMGEVVLTVAPADVLTLCRAARENSELGFNHCRFIAGVDQMEQGIEVVYSLWSFSQRHAVFIKTLVPLADPHLPSVTSVWNGADWHERETAEMFGLVFDGHPNPKHLLLDDDLNIHPLLKAHPLAPIEIKQGVNAF